MIAILVSKSTKMKLDSIFLLSLAILISCGPANEKTSEEMTDEKLTPVFVGTYTRDEGFVNGQSDGIQLTWLNESTGEFSKPSLAAELINPSFLARHPSGKLLYAVSELARPDEPTGYLHSFLIGEDMSLTQVSKRETTGTAPCHVSVDQTGNYVFVANYLGGIVKMYQTSPSGELIERDEVRLEGSGTHERQDASHTHMAKVSPDNRFLFVNDLGANRIWAFEIIHESGKLVPAQIPFFELQAEAGPRHLDFHPSEQLAFVINELDATINSYAYDPSKGKLDLIGSYSSVPEGYVGFNSCADIHVHPGGKFLFGSNRGHDSIVIYEINRESGELKLIGFQSTGGKSPRNFQISENGRFLFAANQDTDNIVTFEINQETGALRQISKTSVMTPVCLVL